MVHHLPHLFLMVTYEYTAIKTRKSMSRFITFINQLCRQKQALILEYMYFFFPFLQRKTVMGKYTQVTTAVISIREYFANIYQEMSNKLYVCISFYYIGFANISHSSIQWYKARPRPCGWYFASECRRYHGHSIAPSLLQGFPRK